MHNDILLALDETRKRLRYDPEEVRTFSRFNFWPNHLIA